jgi:uncharacterized Zn finger protein
LGSYSEGDKFLKRGAEIVQARKLLGASGSLEQRQLRARCRGSSPGEVYSVEVELVAHENGRDLDWAEAKCSCPHAQKAAVCKHVLAVLLARLDPEAWQAAGGALQADWVAAEARPSPRAAAGAAALARAGAPVRAPTAAAPASAQPPARQASAAGTGGTGRKRRLPNLTR